MTFNLARASHSEAVRRRRLQQTKQRFNNVARSTGTVRPLVSRPRGAAGLFGGESDSSAVRRRGGLRRQGMPGRRVFGISLPAGLSIGLPAMPHFQVSWRLASAAIVLLLSAMLARLLTDRQLFIDGLNLGGAALVPGEEIYARSGIAGQHIFWVNPAEVQRNVLAVPGIAGASVSVRWPNIVTIVVVERIPVVTWSENDRVWWVDADGHKFKSREALAGLLPIVVDDADGKASAPNADLVPRAAIHGALQLRELRPNIEELHYDDTHGLSYQDGRGWRGYFGVGTDMAQKLAVYERLTEALTGRGLYPKTISVENLQAPYYVK